MKDVVIIGGGVIGCAVARELSRRKASIVVLEKGNDVAVGTSKANSGIVHAGFDARPKTAKAKFNVAGNAMFDGLAAELDFPFKRNGSMVLCFDKAQADGLSELYARGKENGVPELELIDGARVREIEPNISDNVVAALWARTGGIVSPYEMTIAYAENANANGVEFLFGHAVSGIKKNADGFEVVCANGEKIFTRAVINCAGVYADVINNMVCPEKINITARKGEYMLLDKASSGICRSTLFQMPTRMGKGVTVTPTVHGNVLIGPTSADVEAKDDVDTSAAALAEAWSKALWAIPTLSKRNIITQFAGLRAHADTDDFIIGESGVKGFFNVAGIESPGLTAAPAIAVHVADIAARSLGLSEKTSFDPVRKGIPRFAEMTDEQRAELIKQDPRYGRIVCRCETVTEGEIVNVIKRPLGATDMDGVKRRTRAGMGRCQAGFCTPAVMKILARELNKDLSEITKCGGNSKIVAEETVR